MSAEAVRHIHTAERDMKDHNLVAEHVCVSANRCVRYEKRPVKGADGQVVAGLYNAWITLDNPTQFNSYTTDMVKAVILAFRAASGARDVVAVVFTGAGDKAFCTGGNTKEYAEYYAGNPQEYRGYMRLFNDMVSTILACDKPVICRVNGMRIGGGQEIGMACDFSVAQDLARFGQAGPKHGSAPIGGATDFLPVMSGAERSMAACVLCEPFSAHEAYFMGILTDIVPALKVDGKFVANPLIETVRMTDAFGRFVFGKPKTGDALKAGQELVKRGVVDLAMLDDRIEGLCTKLLYTFPDCTTKTIEELRKPKLDAWNRNKENARAWLALNMMTEARAGFRAFNEGTKDTGREVDFIALRRALAANEKWSDDLTESILPGAAQRRAITAGLPWSDAAAASRK
jgi:6-oxo-cyclohex-1-ene-carbonyl-CoA hydrolase